MEEEEAVEEQAPEAYPRPWWWRALVPAVAVVYGPFFGAAAITWLFVSCGHCKLVWLKYVWVFPGMLSVTIVRILAQSVGTGSIGLSETGEAVIGGIVSIGFVAGVAAVAYTGRVGKWLVLMLALALSTLGALAAFHLVRA